MKPNVALVGFMGAGKTAVGKALARRLGKHYIETDALVEEKAGKTIRDIFEQDGESAFRQLEIDAIENLAGIRDAVVACGGGVVLNWINVDRLKDHAAIVYLKATPDVLLQRTASDAGVRPLLQAHDRRERVSQLLARRRPLYERAADIAVDTSGLTVAGVVHTIVQELGSSAGVD